MHGNPNIEDYSHTHWQAYMCLYYREFLLSLNPARQLYRTESPHPPGHPVTGAELRTAINDTLSITECADKTTRVCLLQTDAPSVSEKTEQTLRTPSSGSSSPLCFYANEGWWVRQNTTVVWSWFIGLTMTTCFGRVWPSSGHKLLYN